jgi:chloride channel protein, CIC family
VIWAVALGSGTSGGVLAPLLIMGGALGALAGGSIMPPADAGFWALLGMAAIMGGTMRAPLTATLFAVELTHDVGLLLPLFTACATSYALTVLILKRSILTEKVARRGHHLSREYHVDPFELTRVAEVMVRKVATLDAGMTIDQAVAFFGGHEVQHKSYPVLGRDGRVAGIVSRSDVLRWRREGSHGEATLGSLVAEQDLMLAYPDEMTGALIDRMVAADRGRVPVISRTDRKLVGLVARRDLLQVRARHQAEERLRQSFLRLRKKEVGTARD